MKSMISSIGIIDKNKQIHCVEFVEGVNVVTGKSSTGKSALLEIFDYCFGNSEMTVPVGIITEHAGIYFTVMRIESFYLVLARSSRTMHAFLKEESKNPIDAIKEYGMEYFDPKYSFDLTEFKKTLKQYFGLNVTDVDTEEVTSTSFYKQKKPAPSARSFTSFMLQHQNLVANKHALFYRFDEIKKREQAIDHFKIFLGFADQDYFTKTQKLNQLLAQSRSLKYKIPNAQKKNKRIAVTFRELLSEYTSITGYSITDFVPEQIAKNPAKYLSLLNSHKIQLKSTSSKHVELLREAKRVVAQKEAALRVARQKKADIEDSIEFSRQHIQKAASTACPEKATLQPSRCPFCASINEKVLDSGYQLQDAINWLNEELASSNQYIELFQKEKKVLKKEISQLKKEIGFEEKKIEKIEKQNAELDKAKTQYELALKLKLKMENILEGALEDPAKKLSDELKDVEKSIREIKAELIADYNIEYKLRHAESELKKYMRELSKNLEFEKSYLPINLEFSFDTFELWSRRNSDTKVFLRSMGSGANWLSCHVALFLGLHKLFCSLGSACSIPSILFLDQPSQVYFPSIDNSSEQFNPTQLSNDSKDKVDADIIAVTNLYSQLVTFCQTTSKETGITPQIIVTDHADNLNLNNKIEFEDLVRARWRDRGFIDPI